MSTKDRNVEHELSVCIVKLIEMIEMREIRRPALSLSIQPITILERELDWPPFSFFVNYI